jgi:hypothetical protein
VRDFKIVKLSPYVRPARRFLNTACCVDLIKAGVTIRLQYAGKVAQVKLRMFALAIRGIREPHRSRRAARCGTTVARTSTAARFWSCPTLVPAPEPECHPRVVSQPPSRDVAALPPAAPAAHSIHLPTPPGWNDPTAHRNAHRFVTDDTAAGGHSEGPVLVLLAEAPAFTGSLPMADGRAFRNVKAGRPPLIRPNWLNVVVRTL